MSLKDGPGEGGWYVFAEKVVSERDALQERVTKYEEALLNILDSVKEADAALQCYYPDLEGVVNDDILSRLDDALVEIARIDREAEYALGGAEATDLAYQARAKKVLTSECGDYRPLNRGVQIYLVCNGPEGQVVFTLPVREIKQQKGADRMQRTMKIVEYYGHKTVIARAVSVTSIEDLESQMLRECLTPAQLDALAQDTNRTT